jgi:hypothetical protein
VIQVTLSFALQQVMPKDSSIRPGLEFLEARKVCRAVSHHGAACMQWNQRILLVAYGMPTQTTARTLLSLQGFSQLLQADCCLSGAS